ncbi:1-(5-phosphoribosyl)-5-[(5-phosphoribosylamino)methylideneamino]imidazole-4-carboxamide isomerase [Desulfobacula sp.]|uniref:1-(5-phosphoribosyl)-5-[(5- phosphoribosylamino)methylideneamino]imidazole-4- carboxamide isomerase n=1 Tax=Desulfobacula sp. TaxID=2593537 RepID=UPI0025BABF30|nr:1-(5-phosphoribosyl)-5-[(5-phosphoribosylamino)methylideneamino]imidazole-4-carboxamide isomerase [Desulfobacula sp.]MBC2705514.1 1-(5-phosphoribosyl)-5-[(5-phosphoribosylamino)methylideneamino]imidazole-4-carboxamide isomerase [Desulfobacula sp.]MCK4767201.1 1-(5-phosphoribosyl)-5-[(5-phosphoribosylamino)methylideneamino]imidazole-4-carboxamide isomerase [Desulfobacula sp.]
MIIIPAVDIKEGKCVRLLQGRMEETTHYSDDPVKMAQRWESQGAALIHVIDLDGAFAKQVKNLQTIRDILAGINVPIQVGGGIRDLNTIEMYVNAGVSKVIIGSEALYNPGLVKDACQQFQGKIVVGIDARDGMVAVEGWSRTSETRAIDLAKEFESCGVAAINFTDIHRDGMQTGPNIEETAALADAVSIPIVASGGVSTIQDIKNLLEIENKGVTGVITGRALYEGSLDLKEAIGISK